MGDRGGGGEILRGSAGLRSFCAGFPVLSSWTRAGARGGSGIFLLLGALFFGGREGAAESGGLGALTLNLSGEKSAADFFRPAGGRRSIFGGPACLSTRGAAAFRPLPGVAPLPDDCDLAELFFLLRGGAGASFSGSDFGLAAGFADLPVLFFFPAALGFAFLAASGLSAITGSAGAATTASVASPFPLSPSKTTPALSDMPGSSA